MEKVKPIHFHNQTVDIDLIDLHPKNSRYITESKKDALDYSLTKYKLQDKIILNAQRKGRFQLIGGQQRLSVYKSKGQTQVEVQVAERYLNKKEVDELLLLHNISGYYDFDELTDHFDDEFLSGVGFDDIDIKTEEIDFSSDNKEIDTDKFKDNMKLVLNYTEADYGKVKEALLKIEKTPEAAVYKLLFG